MNARQRVLAVVHREKADRIPKDLSWGLCPSQVEQFRVRTGCEEYWSYFQLDVRLLDFAPTHEKRDFSSYYAGRDGERGFTVDEWGVGSGKSQNEALHFEHILSPLKDCFDEKAAREFPLPDFLAPYRHAHFAPTVRRWHDEGLAVCGTVVQTLFEKAWYLRGFEETLMDLVDDPEALCILLDRLTALRSEQARLMASAGVDVLMLGDDVGMQTGMLMPPDIWRELFKPRLRTVIRAAREIRPDLPVFYHSCGNPTAIVPDLVEVGVTILNPLQPECMDHRAIKEAFGDRLAFWGGVSAQGAMSFGTPEDVRQEVRRCIEVLGRGGGYLIGPNHVVEPEVPWENLLAFFDAVREFGGE